jgi:hypothetical protein
MSPWRRDATHARMATERTPEKRHMYVGTHPVILCVALSTFIGGLATLITGDVLRLSAVGEALPRGMEMIWGVWYLAGGALIVVGILTLRARLEASGLCLLASATAIWAVAVFVVRGFPDGMLTATLFTGLCVGCWARAFIIVGRHSG